MIFILLLGTKMLEQKSIRMLFRCGEDNIKDHLGYRITFSLPFGSSSKSLHPPRHTLCKSMIVGQNGTWYVFLYCVKNTFAVYHLYVSHESTKILQVSQFKLHWVFSWALGPNEFKPEKGLTCFWYIYANFWDFLNVLNFW